MTYQRKTKDEFVIEGYWGNQYGWELETVEETRREALKRLKEYRENQPEAPHRMRVRRVKLED